MSEIALMHPPVLGIVDFGDDPDERACRSCGCTEGDACVSEAGLTCHWIDVDLCSACEMAEGGA